MDNPGRLRDVIALFLQLGTISFGGPAAHTALMEREVVHKRAWLTREHFLSLLAAVNLVPGPNATEMAIHIGYVHAGRLGLIAGGLAFIIPAFVITLALAWLYVQMGSLPEVAAIFYGINPVVVAIILTATYRLGRTVIKDKRALALFAACLVAALLHINEVLLLFLGGFAGLIFYAWRTKGLHSFIPLLLLSPFPLPQLSLSMLDDRLVQIGLFFLKVGSLMFGSGMVLFAFVQQDIVVNLAWLTQQQLVDAIAAGQMTPGPVLSSATFIGYLLAGAPGAVVGTVGAFLPSFVIVALMGPWIPRLRQSALARDILAGVNAAVVALMLAVAFSLARTAIVDVWSAGLLTLALLTLLRYNVDSVWLIAGGAMIGLLIWIL
jgi:chromate transporter